MQTIDELKQQDLSSASIARETAPKKTWFIKRGDGMIFACQEAEAWGLFENRTNWMRRDFKMLGCSDGTTYAKIIRESTGKSAALLEEINRLESEMARYRKTEEKMVFEDLIDPNGTDPESAADRAKIKRVREIISGYEEKLVQLNDDYRNITRNINQQAFDAELAIARANTKTRGRVEYPTNANIVTPGASPKERRKILRAMSQDDDE